MEHKERWRCLDCGRNTFEGNENYYFLKDRLWRELVSREQRHGMICRACIEGRLGRPLAPEDFKTKTGDKWDAEDQPMGPEDYGIYDSLTPPIRQSIDSAILETVASRPRKVAFIAAYMCEQAPSPIPALHEWFYLDRIAELIEEGALTVTAEGADIRSHTVIAATRLQKSQENR
jgi:hypothetical protein